VFPRSLRLGASNTDDSGREYSTEPPPTQATFVLFLLYDLYYIPTLPGARTLATMTVMTVMTAAPVRPNPIIPRFDHERRLWETGCRHVAGIDEAGRGALAGPVVAAAVMIDPDSAGLPLWGELRDSKLLTPTQRAVLAPQIRAAALTWAVAAVPAGDIDVLGIAAATRAAMQAAVAGLTPPPQHLLIDWVRLPLVNIPQFSCARADQDMVSVAAASILAKVHRDGLMVELDARYGVYGFAQHKGYGAAAHLRALASCGPCPEHRRSFAPIAARADLFDLPQEP